MKLPMEVRRSLPKVAFTKTAYHDMGILDSGTKELRVKTIMETGASEKGMIKELTPKSYYQPKVL